jgi:hypothetical protein
MVTAIAFLNGAFIGLFPWGFLIIKYVTSEIRIQR